MASRTHVSPWIWNLEYILALRYIVTCHEHCHNRYPSIPGVLITSPSEFA